MKIIDAPSASLSGKLDYLRIHRPNAAQRIMNRLLPDSMQILGRVVYEARDIPNLILNTALAGNASYGGCPGVFSGTTQQFYCMTSTVPNFSDMDGTYSRSGTTVTRASGTGVFSAGDVGKEIKFGTGERCHIVTFTNTTTVTVSNAGTIAATSLRRYDGVLLGSTSGFSQQKSSATSAAPVYDYVAGTAVRSWSVIMDAAPTGYTLGSVIIGTAARVVLPVPPFVAAFDQISMSYTLQLTTSGRESHNVALSDVISGFPVQYGINTMSGNGTRVTIATAAAHHFLVGDEIEVMDAIPLKKAVTSASANGTAWTINATAHGFSVMDNVTHEGFSASGYNGTHVVATVINANSYTVLNMANPGASTGGTTRFATPGGYFNGSYVVETVPNSTSVTALSTKMSVAIDPSAKLTSPNIADHMTYGDIFAGLGAYLWGGFVHNEANAKAIPPVSQQASISNTGNSFSNGGGTNISTPPDFGNDFTTTVLPPSASAWGAGGSDENRVKQIQVAAQPTTTGAKQLITFRTPQPKKATHRLSLPGWRSKLTRDLP